MKASEIRDKNSEALVKELDELHQAQFKLRMQGRTGQSFKYDQLRKNRRRIARILTALRARRQQDS